MKQLFLDANAHVPMSVDVIKSIKYHNSTIAGYGHPLSPSVPGQKAQKAIEEARESIAELLFIKDPASIIFTSTCTQACEWAVDTLYSQAKVISYSPLEHAAVRNPIEDRLPETRYKLDCTSSGMVLPDNSQYVACIHVQNEIGTIQPIEKFKAKVLFSDMCQSLGKIPVDLSKVDIATFGMHKIGGPNLGILYLKDINMWKEFGTGSRYFRDRTGTPDTSSIVASVDALRSALYTLDQRTENMIKFQNTLEFELVQNGLEVIGRNVKRVPNTTFVAVPGLALDLLLELGRVGIHVGLGSACGGTLGVSPTVEALGREGNMTDFLRISQFGEYGNDEATYVADNLITILKRLQ